MKRLFIILMIVVYAAIVVDTASAYTSTINSSSGVTAKSAASDIQGQRPYHHPAIEKMKDDAIDWWEARGVPIPCDPAIDIADKLPDGFIAMAIYPSFYDDCRILLRASQVFELIYRVNKVYKRNGWYRHARVEYAWFCQVMYHEMGHIGGKALPAWDREDENWIDRHPLGYSVMSNYNPRLPKACKTQAKTTIQVVKKKRKMRRHKRKR